MREIKATPSPLPAGGQAPALLADREKEKEARIEQFKGRFGKQRERGRQLSPNEFEQPREQLKTALKKN